MKHDRVTQGAFEQMDREQALKEIINERLTTNEKQNVYASEQFNRINKNKIIARKQEYENRLIAIEEEERALIDKKIYLYECLNNCQNELNILSNKLIPA
jgi:outer membrane PBP1 activator LpoA protein